MDWVDRPQKFKSLYEILQLSAKGYFKVLTISLRSPWPTAGKRELLEHPFQACTMEADWNCVVRSRLCSEPHKQNSVMRFTAQSQSASIAHAWNGCPQSSRFPTADQGERSSGKEIKLLTIFFANENDTKKFSCEYWISLGYLIEGGKRTRKKAKTTTTTKK